MSARKPPLLLRGGLTGRVYVVTSYTDHGDGRIEARTKYDVTDQYDVLVREASQTSTPVDAQPAASLVESSAPIRSDMTCGCGKGTVWFDHQRKIWRGCDCAHVKGQTPPERTVPDANRS